MTDDINNDPDTLLPLIQEATAGAGRYAAFITFRDGRPFHYECEDRRRE